MGKQSDIAADVSAGKASSLVTKSATEKMQMSDTACGRSGTSCPQPSSTTYFLPASVAQQQKSKARGQQMIARKTAMTNPIVGPAKEIR